MQQGMQPPGMAQQAYGQLPIAQGVPVPFQPGMMYSQQGYGGYPDNGMGPWAQGYGGYPGYGVGIPYLSMQPQGYGMMLPQPGMAYPSLLQQSYDQMYSDPMVYPGMLQPSYGQLPSPMPYPDYEQGPQE